MDARNRELRTVDRAASIRILHDAFRPDPWMRHVFLADRPGYEERCRAYLEEGHDWHIAGGHPWLGVEAGDTLRGVLYGMAPDPPAAGLPDLLARLAERCGEEARDRFLACEQAAEPLQPLESDGRYHNLALVGVEPALQRTGLGSALLRDWARRCDADPSSQGCILATARVENLPFYARFGYEERGSVPLGEGRNFVMVRPRNGGA